MRTVAEARCHIPLQIGALMTGASVVAGVKGVVSMELDPIGVLVRRQTGKDILIPYVNISFIAFAEDESEKQ